MIKEIKCDLFQANADVLVHQCNCQCTMGSGVARTIKELFPEVYESDCQTKKGDSSKLGTYSYSLVSSVPPEVNPRIKCVVNLYSQDAFGLQARHTSYDALEVGLSRLRSDLEKKGEPGKKVIALPYRMGSDRGGADWNVVRAIIESVFKDSKLTILICDNGSSTSPANAVSK